MWVCLAQKAGQVGRVGCKEKAAKQYSPETLPPALGVRVLVSLMSVSIPICLYLIITTESWLWCKT